MGTLAHRCEFEQGPMLTNVKYGTLLALPRGPLYMGRTYIVVPTHI
jgi:hypothetical protein